uniref:Uncharacterized protein n=1 Tax=Anguilla anguilla TaxID=7936 RepID=A0A0E9UDI5_ANGAN
MLALISSACRPCAAYSQCGSESQLFCLAAFFKIN